MKRYVLDTSALLTLRDDEPGAERVADAWITACAREHGAVLMHKDPEFHVLPIEQEALPLKAKRGKA